MDSADHISYPRPPPIVEKAMDSILRESAIMMDYAIDLDQHGKLFECVSMLELLQTNLAHLAKLADIQVTQHRLPPVHFPEMNENVVNPADDLIMTTTMMTFSDHIRSTGRVDVSVPEFDQSIENIRVYAQGSKATENQVVPSMDGNDGIARSSAHSNSTASDVTPVRVTSPISPTTAIPLSHSSAHIIQNPSTSKPLNARTKWTPEEIALFDEGLQQFGYHAPTKISEFMKTRTSEQVRERIRSLKRKMNLVDK